MLRCIPLLRLSIQLMAKGDKHAARILRGGAERM
jgi:hypothetical protein